MNSIRSRRLKARRNQPIDSLIRLDCMHAQQSIYRQTQKVN